MAEILRLQCPESLVLNLVAPLGLTTRLLIDQGLDSYGLCELPGATRKSLLQASGLADDSEAFHYAGLNHLGFFWPRKQEGEQALAAAVEAQLLNGEEVESFSAAPLHYYGKVFNGKGFRDTGFNGTRVGEPKVAREGGSRSRTLEDLSERVLERFAAAPGEAVAELDERPTPWLEDAVLPSLRARIADVEEEGFGNFANKGRALSYLPENAIVELAGIWRRKGLEARIPPEPPVAVTHFLQKVEKAESLAYEAILSGSRRSLEEALRALPLPIPLDRMDELIEEICRPIAVEEAAPCV